jgi:hypothetical protein
MKLSRTTKKVQHQDMILFSVSGTRFAIRAEAVDEIRNLDGLAPYRASFAANLKGVTHTLVRSKKDPEKTYFVVSGASHFGLSGARLGRVMVLRGGAAAVTVDTIDRMTQVALVHALPRAFSGQEREWYGGLAICDGLVVPVVREETFLNKGELAALAAQHSAAIANGASA